MSPNDPPATESALEQELRRDLKLAYEQMTAITSRLLLASETAEAALMGEDRISISERFLHTTARGMEVRRAAMCRVDGDEISVAATSGLKICASMAGRAKT